MKTLVSKRGAFVASFQKQELLAAGNTLLLLRQYPRRLRGGHRLGAGSFGRGAREGGSDGSHCLHERLLQRSVQRLCGGPSALRSQAASRSGHGMRWLRVRLVGSAGARHFARAAG